MATIREINWFPGHMRKALNRIQEKLKQCDGVIEIGDARTHYAHGVGESEVCRCFHAPCEACRRYEVAIVAVEVLSRSMLELHPFP